MSNFKVMVCLLVIGLCLISETVNAQGGERQFTNARFECVEHSAPPQDNNSRQSMGWGGTLLPTGGTTCVGPTPAIGACSNLSESIKDILTAAECKSTESFREDVFQSTSTWSLDSFCFGLLHNPMIEVMQETCDAMFP